MKHKLLILLAIISLSSCSVSHDDSPSGYYEYLPITSAEVPAEFTYGETYEIKVFFTLPNSCYLFHDIYYEHEGNSRIVAANSFVNTDDACSDVTTDSSHSFAVQCLQTEPYVFKFWQGEDNDGNDQYLTIEVPVVE